MKRYKYTVMLDNGTNIASNDIALLLYLACDCELFTLYGKHEFNSFHFDRHYFMSTQMSEFAINELYFDEFYRFVSMVLTRSERDRFNQYFRGSRIVFDKDYHSYKRGK